MIGYVCMCRDQDDDDDDDNHNDAHSTSRRWRRETKKINAWVVDGRHARRGRRRRRRRRRGKSVAGKALRGNASKAASEACNNIRNVHSATNDKNINEKKRCGAPARIVFTTRQPYIYCIHTNTHKMRKRDIYVCECM